MKVSSLPRDTGPAAWSAILPEGPPPNPLDEGVTADWLVIGAGFAGLAAARRLAMNNPGDRIVIVDAVRLGEGPVGRNSGFMIDLPHVLSSGQYAGEDATDRSEIWANRTAIDFAVEAARDYGLPETAITVSGKINGAASDGGEKHNREYAAHLDRLGEPYQLLDAAGMRAITGSDYYRGGLYTPGTAMLHPAQFARGMAQGLVARSGNRIRLHDTTPVTGLRREAGVWVAETPKATVTAPRVVLAVNGHAQSFGMFRGRLMHVMLYASMTRALTAQETARLGGEADWGITPSDPMGTTVRRISGPDGDRIVVRNRCTFAPGLEASEAQVARMARDHDRSFAARFPGLRDVSMEHRWSGRLCLSLNDVPAFGEVEPGLFSACCQNGLGSAKGTFNGMAAADLASGRETDIVQYQLSKPPPSRLPPAALMRIGAPVRIRWGELKAGAEL